MAATLNEDLASLSLGRRFITLPDQNSTSLDACTSSDDVTLTGWGTDEHDLFGDRSGDDDELGLHEDSSASEAAPHEDGALAPTRDGTGTPGLTPKIDARKAPPSDRMTQKAAKLRGKSVSIDEASVGHRDGDPQRGDPQSGDPRHNDHSPRGDGSDADDARTRSASAPHRAPTPKTPLPGECGDILTRVEGVVADTAEARGCCLDVARRRLPSFPASVLQLGDHLTHLYLDSNLLKSLPADFFARMQILEYLDLRHNRLAEIPGGKSLADHKCLKAVLLQHNQLTSLPMELGNVLTLTTLSFAGNDLKFPPPEVILYGCKAILMFLQESWYKHLLETHGRTSADEANAPPLQDAGDDEDVFGEFSSRSLDQTRSDVTDPTAPPPEETKAPKPRSRSASGSQALARRRSSANRIGSGRDRDAPEVTFPIRQSPVPLQRQKSYSEFKSELFDKLERAGVPVMRRPSRGGSAKGAAFAPKPKPARGRGWRPVGPDYDPDAKEERSPEYFMRLAKDPKTRLRGTRTTSRRLKEDATVNLMDVNAKAVAERHRAVEKEKQEKTEKILARKRSTAALSQWRDEEKIKTLKNRFSTVHLQKAASHKVEPPFEVNPDIKMETKEEKIKNDVRSHHEHLKAMARPGAGAGADDPASPDAYQRLMTDRIAEDRDLHRRIHEHKRRLEYRRLKGDAEDVDVAKQELAEALQLQDAVRKARGAQANLQHRHMKTFADVKT